MQREQEGEAPSARLARGIFVWSKAQRGSVRGKIVSVVVLGQLLTAGVSATALMGLSNNGVVQRRAETLSAAKAHHQHGDMVHDELRAEVYRGAHAAVVGAPLSEREAILAEAVQASMEFRQDIAAIAALDLDPRAAAALADVSPLLHAYIEASVAFLTRVVVDPASSREALPAFEQKFIASADAQQAVLRSLEDVEHEQVEQAETSRRRAMWFVAVGGALTFSSLLVLALWLGRSIVRALERLSKVADRVVAGDLKARAEVPADREIAALARSFNAMADGLTAVVDKLAYDAQRDGLGRQLSEALEMADDEPAVAQVVERAMTEAAPGQQVELRLADSSSAALERFAESPNGAPNCPARSPFACPAIRKGGAVVFPDSGALNACPHLRDRASGPCSAVCIPVSFMGRSLGVLHATGAPAVSADADLVSGLSTVATQAGARIGTVRAFQRTQLQAATDGLTGLINRRTFENELRRVLAAGGPVAVAMADLDHFKALNDTAGHDAGDRALRHFARVLRQTTRAADLVARFGGEEFVFAFPGLDRTSGAALLERLRAALASSFRGDVPTFTCSFGITDSSFGSEVAELVTTADEALYRAKRGGRDRVELGPDVPDIVRAATPSLAPAADARASRNRSPAVGLLHPANDSIFPRTG